jgi:ribose 5-phosphate isomerase A
MSPNLTADDQKRAAASAALEYIQDGMRVGLGSGSTAEHFISVLGKRVSAGLRITAVATSEKSAALAKSLKIPLVELNEIQSLDVTVDGADELDAQLRLIKGGGGALLREKIVAAASKRMIVIADESKKVATLGRFPLPVEIVPFGHKITMWRIVEATMKLGSLRPAISLRGGAAHPFSTDGGHLIADCACESISDPDGLAAAIDAIPGVVGHGLFIGLATLAILGSREGVTVISR